MQVKFYSKRKYVTICLIASLGFSFRGCFNRYISPSSGYSSQQLIQFYNTLSPQEKITLQAVIKELSEEEQKKLASLLDALSPQELNILKELFDQDLSEKGAAQVKQLRLMIEALLKNNHSGDMLRNLVRDLAQEDLSSPEMEKYVTSPQVAQKKELEEGGSETAASPTKKPNNSPPPIIPEWTQPLNKLPLSHSSRKNLEDLLKQHSATEQKDLVALFEHTQDGYKGDFLTALVDLKDMKKQEKLLKTILDLGNKHKELAQKLCSNSLSLKEWAQLFFIALKLEKEQRTLLFEVKRKMTPQ